MIRSSERQSDPDADNMERRDLGRDVIANFQSQSDVVIKPPVHAPAEIDRASDTAVADHQRITAGDERDEFA